MSDNSTFNEIESLGMGKTSRSGIEYALTSFEVSHFSSQIASRGAESEGWGRTGQGSDRGIEPGDSGHSLPSRHPATPASRFSFTQMADGSHDRDCNCEGCCGLIGDGDMGFADPETEGQTSPPTAAAYAFSALPQLSSNPTARAKIYLDFDGHVTSGTIWNSRYTGGADIYTSAFSRDEDTSTFSAADLGYIEEIWKQVAEDFAPFNVDVTTINPGDFSTKTALRVVIGGDSSWIGGRYGGFAYYDTWLYLENTPVFVFEDNLSQIKSVADAISHEVGHAFGLKHQSRYDASGRKTEEYNSGGDGWAPLLGVPYSQPLTTWWKGTTTDSTTVQDDMAVISRSANGFGYRSDDYGNTLSTAERLEPDSVGNFRASGIISQMSDVDVFAFAAASGDVSFTLNLAEVSPNLDGMLELRDSTNRLLASSATNVPGGQVTASIDTFLNAGTYYLGVKSNGEYGRVGQYTIAGTGIFESLQNNDPVSLPVLSVNNVTLTEGDSGSKNATFTVSLSEAASQTVTVDYATADGTAVAGSDYTASRGTLTFSPGQTSQTVSVAVLGDTVVESSETFWLNLSGATNADLGDGQGTATIQDNDTNQENLTLSIGNASRREGDSRQTRFRFTVSLSQASSQTVTVDYSTEDRTATTADRDYIATSGTLTFSPGQTSQTILVKAVGDQKVEANETFSVKLSSSTNATIADGLGIGRIRNDDGSGTLSDGRGHDTLLGVNPDGDAPGSGEIDWLSGGDGDRPYYVGGGSEDLAIVQDFRRRQGDTIQLHGSASDYRLAAATGSLPSGTAIFFGEDLVGVVPGDANLTLNSSAFSFV